MAKRFLIGKMPGIWLLIPVLFYQERSFYPPIVVFDSGAKAKPKVPGPHDGKALLVALWRSICAIGSAKA